MAVRLVNPLDLNECLQLEINLQKKEGFVNPLYQSPSHLQLIIFFWILNSLSDRISQNPLFMLVTGDFIVWSSSWWKIDLTTSEGSQVNSITSSYGLSQPTYILLNSSSYIGLILSIKVISWIVAFTLLCTLIVTIK